MSEFLSRHRAGVTMMFFSSVALLCLSLRVSAYVVGLKSAVWFLFSPEIVYSGEFFDKLDALSGRFFQLVHAEGENFLLRQQNALLSKKEVERDALEEENERLRGMLDLKEKTFPDAVAAEVVGKDVRDWFHTCIIDRGSNDGVEQSAAVVAVTEGKLTLVGRVVDVRSGTSKVTLITDAASAVSAMLGRGGEIGLVEGRNKPWVLMNYLPQKADVVPGDVVETVGLGGLFPPNIVIGKVMSVEPTADGFFKEARVMPASDLGSLREVLILLRKDVQSPVNPASRTPDSNDRTGHVPSNDSNYASGTPGATLGVPRQAGAVMSLKKREAPAR